MRYMMLIYSQENEAVTPEDMRALYNAHVSLMEETRRRGALCAADPLQASTTATVVRVQDGSALITDGPYAETKEQLAGYYILECKDLDEALAWAGKIPTACAGRSGCVEVRPIREYPQPAPVNG
jgi:hypothetical protein